MRDELATRRDAINAARAFEAAHSAIDDAIGSNAALITCVLEVRRRYVSGVAGQAALETMIGGLRTLALARQQIINAHSEAGQVGEHVGLVIRGEGGGYPKPNVIEAEPAADDDRRAA